MDVKILRVDTDERKSGLSLKRAQLGDADIDDLGTPEGKQSSAPAKGGMDDHGALGTDKIEL